MIYLLYLYTVLPAWFVGPMARVEFAPGTPPVYYSGPALAFPVQPTADGRDRLVVVIDPPAPGSRGLAGRSVEP